MSTNTDERARLRSLSQRATPAPWSGTIDWSNAADVECAIEARNALDGLLDAVEVAEREQAARRQQLARVRDEIARILEQSEGAAGHPIIHATRRDLWELREHIERALRMERLRW